MKKALVTGVTGQDGSYLAELLLSKDYKVYGLKRRTSDSKAGHVEHLLNVPNFELVEGDLTDLASLTATMKIIHPDEVYNLAAQSEVGTSFKQPIVTAQITGVGALNCLESIRQANLETHTKFYQASTSEMFGGLFNKPFDESSLFHPRSPYGAAKLYAHWMTINYRESYNMFACSGILFNHESPRRGPYFVTQKIVRGAVDCLLGVDDLYLGNLDAFRDWGHAKDYVRAMWLMLQQDKPQEYVISSGETHSVREFCKIAFDLLGMNYEEHVKIDSRFYRPAEVHVLRGDSSKARKELGWIPEYSFLDLVSEMIAHEKKKRKELNPVGEVVGTKREQ